MCGYPCTVSKHFIFVWILISERFFQKITVSVSTRMSNIIRKELRLKWNTGRSLTQIWFCLVRLKILSFWITIVFNWFKSFCINLQYYLFLFGKALSLSNQEWNFTPPPSKNNKKCGKFRLSSCVGFFSRYSSYLDFLGFIF